MGELALFVDKTEKQEDIIFETDIVDEIDNVTIDDDFIANI
jgi:hypothetical protein